MLLPALLLAASALAADPVLPLDAGRPMPAGTPVVLVLASPGLSASAHQPLVDGLEAQGLDAWLLVLPPARQQLDDAVTDLISTARAALPSPRHALVGHGLGGTLAARAALVEPPAALGLLGAPLAFPDSALATWLCQQELPAGGLDLSEQRDVRWREQPVLELLLGSPLPELDRVGGTWLSDLCTWRDRGGAVDLRQVAVPVWAGAGDLDELGPAEKQRPWLPAQAAFHRFGLLHLETRPYRSVDLLGQPRPAQVLGRWLADQLSARPGG